MKNANQYTVMNMTCQESRLMDMTRNMKIEIFCKKHGWVKTRLYSFKNGDGCPLCKKESRKNAKLKYTTETYINEARSVHGDKYDLSKVV